MDQPGNGLDYDLAECLYNRFQYSSPYNNMLNSKTATPASAAANVKATSVVGAQNVANVNKNPSQLINGSSNGSSSTSASASSPTSTISSCSSSTNKSNGATKNSISPGSSSNQQRSADISPRSIKSSCSDAKSASGCDNSARIELSVKNGIHVEAEENEDADGYADKPNKKSKTGSFNESFSGLFFSSS